MPDQTPDETPIERAERIRAEYSYAARIAADVVLMGNEPMPFSGSNLDSVGQPHDQRQDWESHSSPQGRTHDRVSVEVDPDAVDRRQAYVPIERVAEPEVGD